MAINKRITAFDHLMESREPLPQTLSEGRAEKHEQTWDHHVITA